MRDRRDPLKWPLAVGLALVLTIGLFLYLPADWLDVWSISRYPTGNEEGPPPARWITLIPPPEIVLEPEPEPEQIPDPEKPVPEPWREDPRWWSAAWQVKTGMAVSRDLEPTVVDSVAVLLVELGVGLDFLQQARPDSVLATRLALMQIEDSMRFDELKPYFSAMTRAHAYRDLMSRAADMYNDFLQSEIMVPD